MAKAGELDWSELHKTGQVELDPLSKQYSRPVKKDYHKTGTKPTEEDLKKDVEYIMKGWHGTGEAQWKDEDHLHVELVTEEEAKALQDEWENRLNKSLQHPKIGDDTASEWTGREPLTKDMSEEELIKWRMFTGE
jgi:hypothetical protein